MAIVSFKGKGVCARVCALPEPTDRNCCIRDQKIRKKEDFAFSSTVTCFISFLCAVRCRLNHIYVHVEDYTIRPFQNPFIKDDKSFVL